MFKKHSIQMKMVKDPAEETATDKTDFVTAAYTTEIVATRFMENALKSAIILVAVKATSELTLHVAKTYIK